MQIMLIYNVVQLDRIQTKVFFTNRLKCFFLSRFFGCYLLAEHTDCVKQNRFRLLSLH